jgi:hypothetical protein
MTAKLTPNLRLRNAQDFLEGLVNHPITDPQTIEDGTHKVDRSHYMFIGRTKAWPEILNPLPGNPVISEFSPPSPTASILEDRDTRDHMIALKKIRDVDASLVVKRHNWTQNTIYAVYDVNDGDLFNRPTQADIESGNLGGVVLGAHYVITEDYHVFKCLANGNGGPSLFKPTLPEQEPYTITLTDGYTWKYLYTLTNFQTQYFLTNQWLPVETLREESETLQWSVQQAAINGSIDSYLVDNSGSDYNQILSVDMLPEGESFTLESATANTATITASPFLSTIDNAYSGCHIWINGGSGFPSGPFVITEYNALDRRITIEGTWTVGADTQFEILPRAVISGNGSGASAKVIVDVDSNQVKEILAMNNGQDYTYASVEIVGGKSTGTTATATPQIAPPGGHGADAERELNACYVMLTARLPYDDGSEDFPLSNDYRQIGLIRDVLINDGSSTLANQMTLRASKGIRLTGLSAGAGGSLTPDEEIVGTDSLGNVAKARIIAIINGPGESEATVHYYQDSLTGYTPFSVDMEVQGSVSEATGVIPPGGLLPSEVNINSGDILYIDNRRPILRAPNQTEILRAVIKF